MSFQLQSYQHRTDLDPCLLSVVALKDPHIPLMEVKSSQLFGVGEILAFCPTLLEIGVDGNSKTEPQQ